MFRMPIPVTITGRISSITNAFINSIIPVIPPTEAEVLEALSILQINPADIRCAYCGDKATEWDHLRPLVINQRPTGYASEIANLVPSCGKCNQSKGNKSWRSWMMSNAPQSPLSRRVPDLQAKFDRLAVCETWRDIKPLDFEKIVGSEVWDHHWRNWERVVAEMKESQKLAVEIRASIKAASESD